MLDEREAPVPDDQLDQAFNRKSLGKRTAIVAAGPVFNLIFAVAAFWLMFMIGIPEPRPMVGETEGIAAEAGLERGDVFVRIGDDEVETWTHTILALIPPALDREPVEVVVADAEDRRRELTLPLDRLGPDFREEQVLEHIGLQPWRIDLPPVVGEVSPDSPARAAGVRAGDRIVAVNGDPVDGWRALLQRIPAAAEQGPIELQLERDGETRTVTVAPTTQDGRAIIGVVPVEPDAEAQAAMERATTVLRHGPVAAVGEAVGETWRLTTATLGILGRMITGDASLSNLSGPITIAQMANTSARQGVTRFLFFLGLISLSLAIINLLPIPVLDGGHLLYFLIEWIKGSPVSEQGQIIGQSIGLAMIVGLMGIAIFNDILRLFQ
jgi:regulator of sigma E protease